jgi:hypothetical protein
MNLTQGNVIRVMVSDKFSSLSFVKSRNTVHLFPTSDSTPETQFLSEHFSTFKYR